MHNKMIFVRRLCATEDDDENEDADDVDNHRRLEAQRAGRCGDQEDNNGRAWVYIGSANCSESAWGRLGKDKKTGREKLNCRNWECGVIIPVKRQIRVKQDGGTREGGVELRELFKGLVPVPIEYPGEDYGDQAPWCG